MINRAIKYISPEEYLEMEKDAFEKHEYFLGEVYAMAGATETHILIADNISGELHSFLKGKKCREFSSDFRVSSLLFDTYMYPDIIIVCGKKELKPGVFNTLTNPDVIIEVLSLSTEERSRGMKFLFYRQIPSFKEYLLVETEQCKVTSYRKQDDGAWEEFVIEGITSSLYIATIEMEIPMKEVYALTVFDDEENRII